MFIMHITFSKNVDDYKSLKLWLYSETHRLRILITSNYYFKLNNNKSV